MHFYFTTHAIKKRGIRTDVQKINMSFCVIQLYSMPTDALCNDGKTIFW